MSDVAILGLRAIFVLGSIFFVLVLLSLVGFYSAVRPTRINSDPTPSALGLSYEEVTLTTSDNIRLAGWFIPNKNTNAKTIILLHGYPADKGNILPAMSFLAERYNLMLFDFRYMGSSSGRHSTVGAKEALDLVAAIEWLKERGHTELGIWGFSLGGAVVIMETGNHPEVKVVVADSSYANLYDMTPQLYAIPGLKYPLAWLTRIWAMMLLQVDIKNISPVDAASKLDIPILITHSKTDKVIPFDHALQLQKALQLNNKAVFWWRDDLKHGQLSDSYRKRMEEFFNRYL